MSILPFGSPKQSRFEMGRRPHLESIENLNGATSFGTLKSHHEIAEILFIDSSLQLLSRLSIAPSQCLQGFEQCA